MTVAATLPLAFVMVAGPQIISAFFFATSEKWKSDLGRLRPRWGDRAARSSSRSPTFIGGNPPERASKSSAVEIVIIGLLVVAMVYVFLSRKRSEPPKWMGKLQTATPRFTFTLGFLLSASFRATSSSRS